PLCSLQRVQTLTSAAICARSSAALTWVPFQRLPVSRILYHIERDTGWSSGSSATLLWRLVIARVGLCARPTGRRPPHLATPPAGWRGGEYAPPGQSNRESARGRKDC